MSRRSAARSLVALLAAFRERDTWAQPLLAVRVGVTVKALRACLEDARAEGWPLERVDLSGNLVMWRLPRAWLRGAS